MSPTVTEPVPRRDWRAGGPILRRWGVSVVSAGERDRHATPAGIRQRIAHRWRREGGGVTTLFLPAPVLGGRARGVRTFSRKTDFPPDAPGRWTVDVLTATGQLVGRLRFTIDP